MRKLILSVAVAGALGAAGSAALAQQTGNDTGIATETQERHSEGEDNDFPWDLLGLLGLAGLLGLRRRDHSDDHRAR
jgi:hypothetical protein